MYIVIKKLLNNIFYCCLKNQGDEILRINKKKDSAINDMLS